MTRRSQPHLIRARNVTAELLTLSLALVLIVTSLVFLATLSMELLSAARAYVNGEALWSKAQKDAVLFLTRYGHSRSEADYTLYQTAISVPLGDHTARLELEKPDFDRRVARAGFLNGRNHPEDVDRMIWLFRWFGHVSYIRNAIDIWEQGDGQLEQLERLGARLHEDIASGSATRQSIDQTLSEINRVNSQLTPLEDSFSQTLGEAARRIQGLLFWLLSGGGILLIGAGCVTCYRLLNRIQESEWKYRRLIDTANVAIFISDAATGRMLESNRKAEEILGEPANRFIGTEQPLLSESASPDEKEDGYWKEFVATLSDSNGLNHEMRLRRPDGRVLPVEVSANVIKIGGRTVVQSIVRDVTGRKQAEKALRVARDNALDASRVKGQFLANMSHEIRTPMNGVLGMITVLEATDLTEEQREYVDIAKDSAESLLTIINDILDLSRMEAGRLEIHAEPFALREMAGKVIEMLRGRAKQKGLQLFYRCEPEVPEMLNGDAARLRQILTNLLNNAVKFTEHGSVTLDIHRDTQPGAVECVRFEVRDTGIGISPEALAKLFAPFSQADGSITRKYGGTGLGLAISKQLVELMGGEIGVSSGTGSGSTFWFHVPLNP